MSEATLKVHKARPGADEQHCAVCMAWIKRVPTGQGVGYVHEDSGAVAAPGPDPAETQKEDTHG